MSVGGITNQPKAQIKGTMDSAAEQQKNNQDKLLESNFNKINDQIKDDPKKINRISDKSLNTVKDYINKNPEKAKDISNNITKALKYSKLQNKDRESLVLLENTISRLNSPKINKIETKATTVIPNKISGPDITIPKAIDKNDSDGQDQLEVKNKENMDKSKNTKEIKVASEIIQEVNLSEDIILNKIKDPEQKNFNEKSKNSQLSNAIKLINETENKGDKVNELIKLLNNGDISGFQKTIYKGVQDKASYNQENDKYDGKIGENSFIQLQTYLEENSVENITTTNTKTEAMTEDTQDVVVEKAKKKKETINNKTELYNSIISKLNIDDGMINLENENNIEISRAGKGGLEEDDNGNITNNRLWLDSKGEGNQTYGALIAKSDTGEEFGTLVKYTDPETKNETILSIEGDNNGTLAFKEVEDKGNNNFVVINENPEEITNDETVVNASKKGQSTVEEHAKTSEETQTASQNTGKGIYTKKIEERTSIGEGFKEQPSINGEETTDISESDEQKTKYNNINSLRSGILSQYNGKLNLNEFKDIIVYHDILESMYNSTDNEEFKKIINKENIRTTFSMNMDKNNNIWKGGKTEGTRNGRKYTMTYNKENDELNLNNYIFTKEEFLGA